MGRTVTKPIKFLVNMLNLTRGKRITVTGLNLLQIEFNTKPVYLLHRSTSSYSLNKTKLCESFIVTECSRGILQNMQLRTHEFPHMKGTPWTKIQ